MGDPSGRSAAGTFLYLAPGRYRATVTAYPPTPWRLGTPVPPFACTATGTVALKATSKEAFLELRVSYDPGTDLGATPSRSAEFAVATGAEHYISFAFGCPFNLSIDQLPPPGPTG